MAARNQSGGNERLLVRFFSVSLSVTLVIIGSFFFSLSSLLFFLLQLLYLKGKRKNIARGSNGVMNRV
jgi:hypothetical protein